MRRLDIGWGMVLTVLSACATRQPADVHDRLVRAALDDAAEHLRGDGDLYYITYVWADDEGTSGIGLSRCGFDPSHLPVRRFEGDGILSQCIERSGQSGHPIRAVARAGYPEDHQLRGRALTVLYQDDSGRAEELTVPYALVDGRVRYEMPVAASRSAVVFAAEAR